MPKFLLRKLYKRGTLRETDPDHFAFSLHNPLGSATLVTPPHFVVNGISYNAAVVKSDKADLDAISKDTPFEFSKGTEVEMRFPGRLLRGGNRIHIMVETLEFGTIDFLVEDREAEFCDLPGAKDREEE